VPTLREQLDTLEKLKQRLAVWEAIYFLVDEKFISKDGRKASSIKVKGADDLVPEEEIEGILQFIGANPIHELRAKIDEIESQQVVILGESKAKA
jgi:thioredoxin reductase